MSTYTGNVVEDLNGELILTFPDELMEQVGWKVGDTVVWSKEGDSYVLSKKESEVDKEWVLVETVETFRMRFMVQVPKGKADWALDTVVMEEAKEFSQKFLGNQIISHRVVTEEEAIEICDQDNDYTRSWTKDKKINAFFTKEGEKVENH